MKCNLLYQHFDIGRSVRSTTASVIQIPTTTIPTPIIPKKITKPRQSVQYKLDKRYGTSPRPALFHAVLVYHHVHYHQHLLCQYHIHHVHYHLNQYNHCPQSEATILR